MRNAMTRGIGRVAWGVGVVVALAAPVSAAVSMSDYTAYPLFVSKTVPPNILFIVDVGDKTLPAAYGSYPISRKNGTVTGATYDSHGRVVTDGKLAANVNLSETGGLALVSSSDDGVTANTATVSSPSDLFSPAKTYYGMFDPLRCYTTNSNSFIYASAKTAVSDVCATTYWDGNFLNWLVMRKKDVAYQALVGGTPKPAQANTDGSANSLAGESTTGESGTQNTCNNESSPCWRYVKFVPAATLSGRVPTTGDKALPNPTVSGATGRFFGSGEGKLYVNDDGGADPFDTSSGNRYGLQVDLTSEPDSPSGTGSFSDNCTVGDPSYAGHRVCYQKDRSLGLFQKLKTDNMRVAVLFVNAGTGQGDEKIIVQFDDPKLGGSGFSSLVTSLRNEHIQTHSPLSEGVYEGLCLYQNSSGACYTDNNPVTFTTSVGAQGDPYYFVSNSQMVPCCKSFVLMISPGVADSDGNAPANAVFGNLFSGTNLGVATAASVGGYLDDVALYGHTHDLRSDLTGSQTVAFYTVNSMGGSAGSTLMASAAKYGGFDDRNANGLPDDTGQTCTYPAGATLGTPGSTGASSPEWDTDQNCIPDTYFEAAEGGDLEDQVNKAIAAILKKAASGTSLSVLTSSSTGEGALYQAYFFPTEYQGLNEINWTGYAQGLFIDAVGNVREDTNGNHALDLTVDLIIKTRYDSNTGDVKVDRYNDPDGNGTAGDGSSSGLVDTVSLKDVKPLWEAGRSLALMNPDDRRILTWVDSDGDGAVDAGEANPLLFNQDHASTLAPYLRAGDAPYTAANIIDFIRGKQVSGMRDRQLAVSGCSEPGGLCVWKLGDPVHATPTVVGPPRERFDVIYGDDSYAKFYQKYRQRRQVVYVGANDGMLHAFNAGFYHKGDGGTTHGKFTTTPGSDLTATGPGPLRADTPDLGRELWGFIPQQLLPHLQWLTRTDYTHVYYVDLKPKVTDVRIFTPDDDHPEGWGTILIGGMRLGGSCGSCAAGTGGTPMTVQADFGNGTETRVFYSAYFVLDITNPEKDPVLLWSFSDSSLGLTTSYPSVARIKPACTGDACGLDNGNAKWFIMVGTGQTTYDGNSAQTGQVFALEMPAPYAAGSSLTKTAFATGDTSFMGDLITLDADLDFRADVVYFGDVIKSTTPAWIGKLYRLTTGKSNQASTFGQATAPVDWGLNQAPTVVLSTFPAAGSTKVGPIAAAPAIGRDDSANIWLFFGTGRYLASADKSNTDTQYFFGVKDPVPTGGCTETSLTSCEKKNLLDVSAATICTICTGAEVTGVPGVTTFEGTTTETLQGKVQSMDGWFTTLPTSGERSLSTPTLLAGIVLFTTFIPTNDVCSAAGSGNLYALFYLTGSAYPNPVIGTEKVGGNTNALRSTSLGGGLPSQVAIHIGAQGDEGGGARNEACVQSSTGATLCTKFTPPFASWSRYLSWINERA